MKPFRGLVTRCRKDSGRPGSQNTPPCCVENRLALLPLLYLQFDRFFIAILQALFTFVDIVAECLLPQIPLGWSCASRGRRLGRDCMPGVSETHDVGVPRPRPRQRHTAHTHFMNTIGPASWLIVVSNHWATGRHAFKFSQTPERAGSCASPIAAPTEGEAATLAATPSCLKSGWVIRDANNRLL
jgi:hypothetical protein